MEKDKGNLLIGKFVSNSDTKSDEEKVMHKNQTNPIYRQIFKLVHTKIDSKSDYKSFSEFKPKDLR